MNIESKVYYAIVKQSIFLSSIYLSEKSVKFPYVLNFVQIKSYTKSAVFLSDTMKNFKANEGICKSSPMNIHKVLEI